ncbi:MAG: GDSL-type esterase/lipase family protein [Planococcus sp. (in: firmicutes)]|uniref:SGNH/GDSL hydrolase family protein n=1 Tax=Planococcus halocryophilus TaxID=1215089 RepID=UPI001F0D3F80|nr:GDSL-type esterase/lipase family protein [Planococcus halocryophilus]MCH4827383.1 GDSL-type esterase/lipase family protein [Planococcus halocryophilus]
MLKKLIYLLLIALIFIVITGERNLNSIQLSDESALHTKTVETQSLPSSFSTKLTSGKPVTIVFLGDYVTSDDSLPDGNLNHVGLLASWFNKNYPDQVKIINAGMNANTVSHMKKRIETDVIKHAPDLVVISAGLNDALGAWKIPVKEYAADYQVIIDAILDSSDTEVIIRTPNPTTSAEDNVKMQIYIEASRELTTQDSVYLFDFYQVMADDVHAKNISQLDLMQNKLHPNIRGQTYLSEQFKLYFTSEIIKP